MTPDEFLLLHGTRTTLLRRMSDGQKSDLIGHDGFCHFVDGRPIAWTKERPAPTLVPAFLVIFDQVEKKWFSVEWADGEWWWTPIDFPPPSVQWVYLPTDFPAAGGRAGESGGAGVETGSPANQETPHA